MEKLIASLLNDEFKSIFICILISYYLLLISYYTWHIHSVKSFFS